jgi:hypothetical protein
MQPLIGFVVQGSFSYNFHRKVVLWLFVKSMYNHISLSIFETSYQLKRESNVTSSIPGTPKVNAHDLAFALYET